MTEKRGGRSEGTWWPRSAARGDARRQAQGRLSALRSPGMTWAATVAVTSCSASQRSGVASGAAVDLHGRADDHGSVARQGGHARGDAGVVADLVAEEVEDELGEA